MDRWDLTVVLHRPVNAGPVVLRGAEEYLVQQVVGLVAGDRPPLVHTVVRDPGTVTITFVDWAVGSPDLAASLLAIGYRGELELRVLIARTPELFGWTVEVTADPSTPPPTPGADVDGDTGHVLGAADRFRAFPLPTLTGGDWADSDPTRAATIQHQTRALAGCLIVAAEMITDDLFEDLQAITAGVEVASTHQLSDLPSLMASGYTPGFTRRFLVAFVDLSTRLTRPWTPTSCVAQDLGVRLLTDQAEFVAGTTGLDLPQGWRHLLHQLMLADIDPEYLYDPALAGLVDDPTAGAAERLADWFTPYPDTDPLPPYLDPTPEPA